MPEFPLRLLERQRRDPGALDAAEEALLAEVVDPADALALRRRIALLAAALADLDPLQREVILLRDIQERTAPEAAAELGISIDALKSRLHRARVNLRDHMRARLPGSDAHRPARATASQRPEAVADARTSIFPRSALPSRAATSSVE